MIAIRPEVQKPLNLMKTPSSRGDEVEETFERGFQGLNTRWLNRLFHHSTNDPRAVLEGFSGLSSGSVGKNSEKKEGYDKRFRAVSKEVHALNRLFERSYKGYFKIDPKDGGRLTSHVERECLILARLQLLEPVYNNMIAQAVTSLGMPEKPLAGMVRIYRGVVWPWDRKESKPYSYWIENPMVAASYAKNGDIVVLDVPTDSIIRTVQGEIQLPNPDDAVNARLIVRKHRLVSPNDSHLPALNNLLKQMVRDPNTTALDYIPISEQYRRLLEAEKN